MALGENAAVAAAGAEVQDVDVSSIDGLSTGDELFDDAEEGDMDLELRENETDKERRVRLSRSLHQRMELKRKAKKEEKKNRKQQQLQLHREGVRRNGKNGTA